MKMSGGLFFEKLDRRVDSTVSGWARYIDNGSFFKDPISIIYRLIAFITMIFPLYLLLKAYDSGFLSSHTEGKLLALALMLIFLAVPICWVSGSIWWYRSRELSTITKGNSYFVTTPIFAHLLRTCGEAYGMLFCVLGCVVNVFLSIFDVDLFLFRFIDYGTKGVIMCPLVGYFIIIITRFLSELIQAAVDALSAKLPNVSGNAQQVASDALAADVSANVAENYDKAERSFTEQPINRQTGNAAKRRVLNLRVLAILLIVAICSIAAILVLSGHQREASPKTEEELLYEQAIGKGEGYDFSGEVEENQDEQKSKK